MRRTRVAAGAMLLLLCGQYFFAEAIAAAAWTHPYSYSRNFVSDLGVTTCAVAGPCSPLGVVMNASFVLSGALAIVAAAVLSPLLPRPVLRRGLLALAIIHGVGSTIVGLVESAPGAATGTPHLHVLGAYGAICGGNLALIMAGCGTDRRWARPWFRATSVALGALGLSSGLALVTTRGLPAGLLERGAIDTITLWEVAAGALLAFELGRRPRQAATTVSV